MSRIWQALRQAEQERRGLRTSEASIEEMDREPAEADESSTARALDRRKVLRHSYQATLLVYGSDAEKQPFHENCQTIDANDTGCLFSLASSVSRGQRLFLTNMRNQAELECRIVYVGRRVQGNSRIGVEFLRPSPQFWRGE